jgi:hypothetical protein
VARTATGPGGNTAEFSAQDRGVAVERRTDERSTAGAGNSSRPWTKGRRHGAETPFRERILRHLHEKLSTRSTGV